MPSPGSALRKRALCCGNVESHVVELDRLAGWGEHVAHDRTAQPLRRAVEMMAQHDGAHEALRVGWTRGPALEPAVDIREAGSLERPRRDARSREVPRALPAGEALRVRLL